MRVWSNSKAAKVVKILSNLTVAIVSDRHVNCHSDSILVKVTRLEKKPGYRWNLRLQVICPEIFRPTSFQSQLKLYRKNSKGLAHRSNTLHPLVLPQGIQILRVDLKRVNQEEEALSEAICKVCCIKAMIIVLTTCHNRVCALT